MNLSFCSKTPFPIRACRPHTHTGWEVIYHLTGSNRSVIGNNRYTVGVGEVLLVPPGVVHSAESDGRYTDMYLQAESLDFYDAAVIHDYDGSIFVLFKMLLSCFAQKDQNYREICDALLEAIVLYLKKYLAVHCKHPFVYRLKNYIYENVSNPDFCATDMAAFAGYHVDYVRRSFFEEMGKTPTGYLTELRIELAKKLLLQETFVSVKDVALKCGFVDSFYFSTLFRKKTGLSPSAYQKAGGGKK